MKKELYYKRSLRYRLIFLIVAIVITLIEVDTFFLEVSIVAALIILGYKYFLLTDYRIAFDEENLYLDNLYKSKAILLSQVIIIDRNKWIFTKQGAFREYGYKIFYTEDGEIKEVDALVDSEYFELMEKWRKEKFIPAHQL